MSDEWPVAADGLTFHHIPAEWIDQGRDRGEGDVRLFAVSAAPISGGRTLKIRYSHPQAPRILYGWSHAVAADAGAPAVAGRRPKTLPWGDWPRSVTPTRDPDDRRRGPEARHLRDLWGERVDVVPTDADVEAAIRADGGPVFGFGGER